MSVLYIIPMPQNSVRCTRLVYGRILMFNSLLMGRSCLWFLFVIVVIVVMCLQSAVRVSVRSQANWDKHFIIFFFQFANCLKWLMIMKDCKTLAKLVGLEAFQCSIQKPCTHSFPCPFFKLNFMVCNSWLN